MDLWRELPIRDPNGNLQVVVESPRGSELKLKYNADSDRFTWSRALPSGLRFPHDYGFIPQTLSGDGDALDALIYSSVASFPGIIVPARPIGTLRMEQLREGQPAKRNDRLVVIPTNDHRLAHITSSDDLPERVRQEIQSFFEASLGLTGKRVGFLGWAGLSETDKLIDSAHQAMLAQDP